MIRFNISIWNEGTLNGMREVSTDEFDYTELYPSHYGYQGPEGINEVFKDEIRKRCENILDEVQELYDFMHSFDFLAKLDKREKPRSLSHLSEYDYKQLNVILKDLPNKISTPEDVDYVLKTKLLGLTPETIIEVYNYLLGKGIRYRFS